MGVPLTPYYSRIGVAIKKGKSSLTPYYTRVRNAADKGETAPDIGQVSELIRNTLTKEYNIYPPNLSTAIQPDQSIVITAVNPDTGLNLQVVIKNLAGNLVAQGGTTPGVVPPGAPEAAAGPGV
jgi:hypothetical protein